MSMSMQCCLSLLLACSYVGARQKRLCSGGKTGRWEQGQSPAGALPLLLHQNPGPPLPSTPTPASPSPSAASPGLTSTTHSLGSWVRAEKPRGRSSLRGSSRHFWRNWSTSSCRAWGRRGGEAGGWWVGAMLHARAQASEPTPRMHMHECTCRRPSRDGFSTKQRAPALLSKQALTLSSSCSVRSRASGLSGMG